VPYNGGGPAAVGAMTNQVQALFSGVVPVLGLVQGQKLKPLAVAAERRFDLLPDVPTFAEQGLPYRTGTWYGLLAPAKTPAGIIERLNRVTVEVLQDPAVRAKIVEQGAEVVANTPAQFRAFLKEETDRLSAVIRNANIALD
jgi:tripartite-type tricarboxylate transporter receptor subunit TctC